MKSRLGLFILTLFFFFCSCKQLESKNNNGISNVYPDTIHAALIAGSFIESSPISIDSILIQRFFNIYNSFKPYQEEVFQFYRNRAYELAWHDSSGKIEAYQVLFNSVMQMEENGLTAQIFYLDDFKRYTNKQKNDSIEFVDLMQTAQYFHFARSVLEGLPEQKLRLLDWHIPKAKKNYTDLLDKFISGEKDVFEKSVYPQYHFLRKALIHLRQIEQNGGWPMVTINNIALKEGIKDHTITAIKKRLKVSGEWPLEDSSDLFNNELSNAVKIFQQKNGLLADGIVGRNTVNAMNVSVADRIKQIMVNMERCRWLPIHKEGDYILVNIPAFSLQVLNGDSLIFECEAIVGKETNKTAIFKGMIKYVVFNPYWNVPDQILKKEILPALSKNSNYLKKNNMEWYEGRVRQLPGPDNALGAIKFLFPNPFDIYLHDTPAKGLFREQRRAFSHGCIRISAPHRLANYLLRNHVGWSTQKMDDLLSSSNEEYVKLDKEVPVYILYLTAFGDHQGNLNFREDLYQKDQALESIILKN
jgi:murein L,D-transpeptidase YcbB/YkuD